MMRRMLLSLPIPFLLLSWIPVTEAGDVVVDFENLARGEIVNEQYISDGLRISAMNWSHGPDHAVVFDTTDIGSSDDEDLEAPFRPAADLEEEEELWPGNILILHERDDCENGFCGEPDDEGSRPAGWLELEFSEPVTLHRLKLLDINYEPGDEPAKFVFYDISGAVFETMDIPEVARQGSWRLWEINISGIKRARLYLPGDGALDDIEFSRESEEVNWTPVFESHPPVAAAPDSIYQYQPAVRDLDGDSLAFELLTAPDDMVVEENGGISWEAGNEAGEYPVSIRASDGNGGEAVQSFLVHVTDRFAHNQGFEFEIGTIVDNELLADGVLVTAKNLSSGSDYAVTFDTVNPTGGDFDLEAPFREGSELRADLGDAYPGKIIILHEDHDCDHLETSCSEPNDETTKPAGWIEFRFTQPTHVWSLDVFDVISANPDARRIELYDVAGNRFRHELTLPRTGSNKWNRLIVDAQGVMRMRVNLDGDAGLDNLNYALIGSPLDSNRTPVAEPDNYELAQGATLDIPAPGILENDYDPDGDDLTASLYQSTLHGELALTPDGGFSYAPLADFSGEDSFQYRADDGEAVSTPTTATISVLPDTSRAVIEAFTALPDVITLDETATLAWTVSNAETISIMPGLGTQPASGSVSVSPQETTTYTLSAAGTDGETVTQSRTVTVLEPEPEPEPEPDPEPTGPQIAFYWPEEGGGVNWHTPPLALDILETTVMGVDPGSAQITLNGESWPVDCYYNGRFVICNPLSDIPVGSHVATARVADYVGDYSNTVTLNFYVDVTPPPSPDPTKLSITSTEPDGRVTVTGDSSAAEPGNTVQVRSDHMTANGVEIASDGSFSSRVRANPGEEVTVKVRDGARNYSDPVILVVPAPAPIIAIESPMAGELLNSNRPEILIAYLQHGAGIDYSSLSFSANGAVMTTDCFHETDTSRCTPISELPEGVNTVTAIVSDTNDVASNVTEVAFHVDTVPPEPPVRENISLTQGQEGQVSINGVSGAVEASVAVIIQHAGIEHQMSSGELGEFSFALSAVTGDEIRITAMDAAGNRSTEEVFVVPPVPLHVTILSPYEGEHLSGNNVTVRGTHSGGPNTGVTVNGTRAMVTSDGTFVATGVPLADGQNEITVEVVSFSGEAGNAQVNVTSEALPPTANLTASQNEAPAPAHVNFDFDYIGNINGIHHYELDADGDGVSEIVFTDPSIELSHVYTVPGIYTPKLLVYTQDGVIEAETIVNVLSADDMHVVFQSIWNGWQADLINGDVQAALRYIVPSKRERYESVFEGLNDRWPQIFQSFTAFKPAILSGEFSEYAVNRTIDGEERLFLVYFTQDDSGVWRLYSF